MGDPWRKRRRYRASRGDPCNKKDSTELHGAIRAQRAELKSANGKKKQLDGNVGNQTAATVERYRAGLFEEIRAEGAEMKEKIGREPVMGQPLPAGPGHEGGGVAGGSPLLRERGRPGHQGSRDRS